MKILVLADHESKSLYEYYTPEKLNDIDLIISCGDLRANYLSFFATCSHAPVYYVRGNHDNKYKNSPPEGCTCIEDDIVTFHGIRILGLGGSMEYIPGSPDQYTENKMDHRIKKLWWKLRKHKGFDILVTHAPAYQLNDLPDLPHRGFFCFKTLMEKYSPKYFFHGHIHANYGEVFKREDTYGKTTVINAYEYYILEYPVSL
ncbi:metallophosphoesterase [Clostridium sp. E02]|uniref:metallophosphoesterase family protein n=1 Tax=Clostridium sp. E02 TaxID=2487134 RepID=UPI000F5411D4|nr:metallophosphoesterase [Clostridium sp. E02]